MEYFKAIRSITEGFIVDSHGRLTFHAVNLAVGVMMLFLLAVLLIKRMADFKTKEE